MSVAVIMGNIGRIGELRETRTGKSVINFSVAETKRRRVQGGGPNEWEDGDTIWYDLTAWGRLAQNLVAVGDDGEPLIKGGTNVLIYAHYDLKQGFTTKNGEEVGPRPQLVADDIAVSIRSWPATSPRLANQGGGGAKASRPAPAQKRQAPVSKPAPQPSDDNFDDLFEDDDDFFG